MQLDDKMIFIGEIVARTESLASTQMLTKHRKSLICNLGATIDTNVLCLIAVHQRSKYTKQLPSVVTFNLPSMQICENTRNPVFEVNCLYIDPTHTHNKL